MNQSLLDDTLVTLANKHRRRVLVSLLEHNPQEDDSVPVLEDAHEEGEELEVLRAQMYHSHLPKLEEAGFIKWDMENHEVIKGPRFEEIQPLLELMQNHKDELPGDWV